MRSFTFSSIQLPHDRGGRELQLVFEGVEQAGPSFEARVFLDNPGADESTPLTDDAGYAGSFHVFGYGAAAPPAMQEARTAREPGSAPVAPIEKRLRVDPVVAGRVVDGADELTVTVVSVPVEAGDDVPARPSERVQAVFER